MVVLVLYLPNSWGLLDIFDDPSQQHYYNFCYTGLTLITTTVQLQDCWSNTPLSPIKTFSLNVAGTNCFTDTVAANTPIGTASYSIAPTSGTVALTDYHNGEAYINTSLLPTGTYTVTYSFRPPLADSCPTITGTFNITMTPGFTVSVNSATVCAGTSATLTASGTTAPATYSWSISSSLSSTSGASVTATPSVTNIYTVTGTHTGCAATSIATSTISVNPSPTVTVNSATICAGGTGTLTATGATTYSWTPATGLSSTTGSMATGNPTVTAIYTVSGTTGGCNSTATATITVNPTPTITVNNASICIGGTATLTVSGATTYSWNTGATTATITPSPTVTTNYTVTGTDIHSCVNTATTAVMVNPTPTITVNNATVCIGSSATLTANGATTYTWNTSATGTTINPSPTVTTNYTVSGTSGGCTSSATSTITVNPLPSISVNSVTICVGSTTSLTANGASTYTWNTAAISPSITPSPTVTTNYTVTGTDINNCKNTATSTVTVNPLPTVTVNSATICDGNSATLTASNANTYTWNTSATGATISPSPTVTTNYTVTGTNIHNCKNTAISIVTVNPSITVTVNSATICLGATATLTANGASTYSWTPSVGIPTSNTVTANPSTTAIYTVTGITGVCSATATSTVTVNPLPTINVNSSAICIGNTATLTASGANTYTWNTSATTTVIHVSPTITTNYTVVGTDIHNCKNTGTSTVTVNPLPIITVNNATVCIGNIATLTANGATTYTWNTSATGATITSSPTLNTTYTVTGTNANNCINKATAIVTVNPLPTITANSATICVGTNAIINASGANTYTWNTSATGATISPSPTVTTNYTVTGTNANGCINEAVASVHVNPTPTVVATGSSSVCVGQTISLSSYAISGAVYQWSGPNGFTASSPTTTIHNTNELNAGTYTLTIISAGCSATNTIAVSVDSMPTIAHAGMDTTIYNSSISLTGNVPLLGSGIWSVISGSGTFVNGSSANTQVNNLQTGQNVLQWTITNGVCPASFDDVIITVIALMIPNGFSPNGDAMNEYFEIKGLEEYSNVKLNIFNRWGNEVYESADYKNDWNGKNMSGENLSDDTYFYTIEIPSKNTFKGYVILKRK